VNLRSLLLTSTLLLAARLAGAEGTHTVQTGESVDGIARRYGVSVEAVAKANNLARPELIAVGQKLAIPDSPDAPKKYTVEEGDTLGSIAHDQGASQQRIMELNKLDNPDNLTAGQTLLIPQGAEPARTPATTLALPAELKKQLDAIPVKTGRWRYIVVHHSATREGSARSMDLYHRRRGMENGLAYHFVIGNGRGTGDGVIEVGNRWKRQIKGGHLASERLNEISIGICLVGNFNNNRPTQAQMRSLRALVQYAMMRSRTGVGSVKIHRQINTKPTECPGRQFPTPQMLQGL
jgi:LysM repeat protein